MRKHLGTWLSALVAGLCLLALPAQAQIRRCTTADGGHVYTDRECKDVGAVERQPRQAGQSGRLIRRDCSRNVQDLVFEMTAAIDNRDVNRLAGIYEWNGMSTSNAYAVMDRLDAIAQRPLVDVLPVVPRPPDEDGTLVDGEYYPQEAVRRAPVGLRLEQTIGKSATPSRTVLGLRRYMDCWWVRL